MKKCALILLCVLLLIPSAAAIPQDGGEQFALLEEIKEYLDEYHLYPSKDGTILDVSPGALEDDAELLRKIADGWLSEDRYGYFMTADEYEEAYPSATTTVGIGIQVDTSMAVGTYVSGFLEDSSALRSGMEVGCLIVAVNGRDVTDEPFLEVTRPLIAGNIPLSKVTISYINPGSTTVRTEEFTRSYLNLPPHVSGTLLEDGVGYIRIAQFGTLSDYYSFADIYHEEMPALGADSVIIDLRGNPGGELDTLLNIMNCMLPEENLLLIRMLYRGENEEFLSTGQDEEVIWQPEKIVVLIDGDSYSASEVFAGTLKELGMATIVGTNSGGKSRAQYHQPLSSGDVLVFTYSDIELQNTGSYDSIGIIPNVVIENHITSGIDLDFGDLGGRALYRYCRDEDRVLALETHLEALGYFRATPDGRLDDYSFWCFNRFQTAQNLTVTSYAGWEDLALLRELCDESEFMPEDTQLDTAISICLGEY